MYHVSVACLQETKCSAGLDDTIGNYRIVLNPADTRHYGQGFAIHTKLINRIHKFWKVSDRVSVLQLTLCAKSSSRISIINVYAPTSTRVAKSTDEIDEFYSTVSTMYSNLASYTTVFIVGDWNAKVGLGKYGERCIGSHRRGRRNMTGELRATAIVFV